MLAGWGSRPQQEGYGLESHTKIRLMERTEITWRYLLTYLIFLNIRKHAFRVSFQKLMEDHPCQGLSGGMSPERCMYGRILSSLLFCIVWSLLLQTICFCSWVGALNPPPVILYQTAKSKRVHVYHLFHIFEGFKKCWRLGTVLALALNLEACLTYISVTISFLSFLFFYTLPWLKRNNCFCFVLPFPTCLEKQWYRDQ